MPLFDDHIRKAEHNSRFYKSLDAATYPDWVVCAVFYTALHCVDAVLLINHIDPPSHHLRDSYIPRNPKLNPIYNHYRSLEDLSREARYNEKRVMTQQEVQDCLADLKTIGQHISDVLGVSIRF